MGLSFGITGTLHTVSHVLAYTKDASDSQGIIPLEISPATVVDGKIHALIPGLWCQPSGRPNTTSLGILNINICLLQSVLLPQSSFLLPPLFQI